MRFAWLLVLLSLAPSGAGIAAVAAPDPGFATIILVRHAERDTMLVGPDHPLRAVGVVRGA